METLKINTTTDTDGHLKIDVNTSMIEVDVEVVLVIEARKKNEVKYDFSDLAGKLKWDGDVIELQRKLRDEWQ